MKDRHESLVRRATVLEGAGIRCVRLEIPEELPEAEVKKRLDRFEALIVEGEVEIPRVCEERQCSRFELEAKILYPQGGAHGEMGQPLGVVGEVLEATPEGAAIVVSLDSLPLEGLGGDLIEAPPDAGEGSDHPEIVDGEGSLGGLDGDA